MNEEEKWNLLHEYTNAVKDSKCVPLMCRKDLSPLYVKANDDFEPILYCYSCQTNYIPGLITLDKIKQLLKETR